MKILRNYIFFSCLVFFLTINHYHAYSMIGVCGIYTDFCHDSVPSFIVDFTGNPDSLWCSPPIDRNCQCCNVTGNFICVQFWVYMDDNADLVDLICTVAPCPVGINVVIDCNVILPTTWGSGTPICLAGKPLGVPYHISACKNGPDPLTVFCIQSIRKKKLFDDDWIASFAPIFEECKNTSDPDSMQVPFVSPDTLINFTLTFGDPFACLNDTIIVDSSSLWTNGSINVCDAAAAGPIWYPGDTIWHTYDSLGFYSVCLMQVLAGCDITICGTVTNTKVLTAYPVNGCSPLTVNFLSCDAVSYQWDFGDSSPTDTTQNPTHTFTNTATFIDSIYTVILIATDSLGFTDTMTQDITVHPKLAALFTVDTITVISPFQFIVTITNSSINADNVFWDFGDGNTSTDTSETFTHTYTFNTLCDSTKYSLQLIVENNYGCTDTDSVKVAAPYYFNTYITNTNVSCNGGSDGTADLTVIGFSPYSYSWSNGAITEDISGLTAGIYTVTVTDDMGCTITDSATIIEPPPLIVTVSNINNASCYDGNDGAVDLMVSGGITPYFYLWSNGDTTEDISGLATGIYIVIVTDSNGCNANDSVIINEPSALTISKSITEPSCKALCDGSIILNVSGGTAPYTYYCGIVPCDFNNMCAGYHYVLVTDSQGCSISDDSIIISGPDSIIITSIVEPANQGNNNGAIDLNVTGGTPPYAFTWSNGDTTEDIDSLIAGIYQVLVTDSLGCIDSLTIAVPEATGITEANLDNDITIFPNPFSNETAITITPLNNNKFHKMNISFYDLSGKIQNVSHSIIKLRNGMAEITVHKGSLASGIYYFKIRSAKILIGKGKLVIE